MRLKVGRSVSAERGFQLKDVRLANLRLKSNVQWLMDNLNEVSKTYGIKDSKKIKVIFCST